MVGFRDEHDGSLSTNQMTTDFIEPARIERGEIPGWVQLQSDKELAITYMLALHYSDRLPEKAEASARVRTDPPVPSKNDPGGAVAGPGTQYSSTTCCT